MDEATLERMRAEARIRFKGRIEFIKELVGPGQEYDNGLVRAVLSESGAYYEMIDLPEEFSGAIGPYEHEFIDTPNSAKQLESILDYIEQGHIQERAYGFDLLVLYSRNPMDRENVYIFHYNPQEIDEPQKVGRIQPSKLPDFYKVKWTLKPDQDVGSLPYQKGIVFFIRNMTDQNLIVRIDQTTESMDLSGIGSSTVH